MKQLTGIVISSKTLQSAVVVVETLWKHPMYLKTVKRTKKYLVENTVGAKTGDTVSLEQCRPLSARKRFTITKIVKK